MEKLKIFVTFDHELPLGALNTTYQKALFEPTCKILDLADKLQIKVTLFTDVICALRYKEWDYENFYKPYINQLKDALIRGHDVQLHLHPHWLSSTFNNGTVKPSNDFKLSDFKDKEYPGNIPGIIQTGYSFLNSVCTEILPGYKCVAFRAGGHCLSPDSALIFSNLYKNGIRFDSSICKGYYYKSAISKVDFTHVPSVPNWFIGLNGNYSTIADSGILEIPIAGKPKQLLEVPTRFKMKKYSRRAPENHGAQIHEGKPSGSFYNIKKSLSSRLLNFDNYTYSASYLMQILNYYVSKNHSHETIMLSVIGHPKSMGDYSLHLMKSFIEDTRKKYDEKVEFCTYQQLSKELLIVNGKL